MAICDALQLDLAGIRATENRIQQEIALLREYRTRLIADVVTGKLDVREAAANLPDEPQEQEGLAEEGPALDDDETPSGALEPIPGEAEA